MNKAGSRAALVTGASRGIGRDIAIALASAGYDVAIGYNKDAAGAEAAMATITQSPSQAKIATVMLAQNDSIFLPHLTGAWSLDERRRAFLFAPGLVQSTFENAGA